MLGPAEVLVDERVVPIQGGKLLTVLAGLLLRANQVVSVEQLGRWLWDDAAVDSQRARATVQEYTKVEQSKSNNCAHVAALAKIP